MGMPLDDIGVFYEHDDFYSVYATSPRAQAIVERVYPSMKSPAWAEGDGVTISGAVLCCDECARSWCDDLRNAGLTVYFWPRWAEESCKAVN
jgi:hypothetical protein